MSGGSAILSFPFDRREKITVLKQMCAFRQVRELDLGICGVEQRVFEAQSRYEGGCGERTEGSGGST